MKEEDIKNATEYTCCFCKKIYLLNEENRWLPHNGFIFADLDSSNFDTMDKLEQGEHWEYACDECVFVRLNVGLRKLRQLERKEKTND